MTFCLISVKLKHKDKPKIKRRFNFLKQRFSAKKLCLKEIKQRDILTKQRLLFLLHPIDLGIKCGNYCFEIIIR
jgi:hypothetical protein